MCFFKYSVTMGPWVLMASVALGLSACSSVPVKKVHQQNFSPAFTGAGGGSVSLPKKNLPSASLDTPLCGKALHERARADAVLYPRSVQSGKSCVRNACFQPLTGTYVAQNGQITVCR